MTCNVTFPCPYSPPDLADLILTFGSTFSWTFVKKVYDSRYRCKMNMTFSEVSLHYFAKGIGKENPTFGSLTLSLRPRVDLMP